MTRLTHELRPALASADLPVRCSLGVVTCQDGATSVEQAVAAANESMDEVKRSGKGGRYWVTRSAAAARR